MKRAPRALHVAAATTVYDVTLTHQSRSPKCREGWDKDAFADTITKNRHKVSEARGKKYCRAVKAVDGTCAVLRTVCVAAGAVGASLLASGVGFVAGLVLEAVTGVSGLLDVVVSRKCSVKAAKHEAVRVLASSKLNTVHSHISKALEDCEISDEEYKLILDEVEKYQQ